MEKIYSIIGWGIVSLLCISLLVLVIAIILSFINNIRKDNPQKSTIYLVVFGGIFVFVLFSLGMLVIAQYRTLGEGHISADAGTFLALISLSLSLAAIVPFFVTKALTEKEVDRKVDVVLKDREKQIMKMVRLAESRLHTSDADISRMIGYLLVNDKPDYFWSLSWLARSIKSRKSADEDSYGEVDRSASSLFIKQELRMIAANIVKIYADVPKEGFGKLFEDYDSDFEARYTGESRCPQGTLARVLRDYVYLIDDMQGGGDLFKRIDDKSECSALVRLLENLCVEILKYLVGDGKQMTLQKLSDKMVCRSFKKDADVSLTDKLASLYEKRNIKFDAQDALAAMKEFQWFAEIKNLSSPEIGLPIVEQ